MRTRYTRNTASGRMLLKNGMKQGGVLKGHVKKWDKFEDYVCYGILRAEYLPLDI